MQNLSAAAHDVTLVGSACLLPFFILFYYERVMSARFVLRLSLRQVSLEPRLVSTIDDYEMMRV